MITDQKEESMEGNTRDYQRENPEGLQELRRYFQPKTEVVQALPDPDTVIDMTEVVLKTTVGQETTYVMYKMIEGKWIGFVQAQSGGA